MTKICLCIKIQIPIILKNYRFYEISQNENYYDPAKENFHASRIYQENLFPFFKAIIKLSKANSERIKLGISISGSTLQILQRFVPKAIETLSNLKQRGCVEFLSEPWSHSIVAYSSEKTLQEQSHLHGKLIKSIFGTSPSVFIIHSPVCSDKIWRTVFDNGKNGIILYSNHLKKESVNSNDTNKTLSPSTQGVFLINQAESQRFQNMDLNVDDQIVSDFTSGILNKTKDSDNLINPLILIYNPSLYMRPFDKNRAHYFQAAITQLLDNPGVDLVLPSELTKMSNAVVLDDNSPDSSVSQFKLQNNFWIQNDLQKKALKDQMYLNKQMEVCHQTSLIENWHLIQESDNLNFMDNQYLSNSYCENVFNPYASPYLAFINYMNILEDFSGRLDKKFFQKKVDNYELKTTLRKKNKAKHINIT